MGMWFFHALGTLKHAQIAAVEWNREVIARVKAGVGVYGKSASRVSSFMPGLVEFYMVHVGAAPQPGNTVVTRFEMSIQEIEELQD